MLLDEFQKKFSSYLYTSQTAELEKEMSLFFTDDETTKVGLKVYRNNLIFALKETLENRFPCVQTLLGENNFNFFCREYIYNHPSQNKDIRSYGEDFGIFLKTRSELAESRWIADLAMFESAVYSCSGSTTDEVVTLEQWGEMAETPLRDLSIKFISRFRIIHLSHDVPEVWRSMTEGNDEEVELKENSRFLCVFGQGEEVYWKDLDERYIQLLTVLISGDCVTESHSLRKGELRTVLETAIKQKWIQSISARSGV